VLPMGRGFAFAFRFISVSRTAKLIGETAQSRGHPLPMSQLRNRGASTEPRTYLRCLDCAYVGRDQSLSHRHSLLL
jgi:hypothetical protein